MQTLLLYRLKAQSHSRGLFLFFIMQIAIVVACYQKQLNLTIALIGISAVLPFILQIIFVKPISGASYKVYNMLYIVAKQIKERGQMLNLYI